MIKTLAELINKTHLILKKPLPIDTKEILVKIIARPSMVSKMIGLFSVKKYKALKSLVENEEWISG